MSTTIALSAHQSKTSVELEGIVERVGLGRTSLWRKERIDVSIVDLATAAQWQADAEAGVAALGRFVKRLEGP